MTIKEVNTPAPDFSTIDVDGNPISLSDFKWKKHVILVMNRGFV
jgi:peroxiredoxin